MPYQVDYNKSPKSLLLGLLNVANQLELTLEQLDFTNLTTSSKAGYNTQVDVWWKTTADMVGKVTVHYNRMDIRTVFSLTGILVKELNLDMVGAMPVNNERVFAEIQRRYGFSATYEDFQLSISESNAALVAAESNVAYLGQADIAIEYSLATRVHNLELDGFTFIRPNDISFFLTDANTPADWLPAAYGNPLPSAEMLTRAIDCTDFINLLAINASGGFVNHALLLARLAEEDVPSFTVDTVKSPAKLYVTPNYPDANQAFTHVVVIENVVSAGMIGRAMFHYSVYN